MALGEILKQKRIERGWTRETVSERTHMMVRSIEALETENYKRIPAPIYGRGFIKHYCEVLDIDPLPLIDEYMRAVDSSYKPLPVTRPTVQDLPPRPLEPIHTGARRTLPPTEPARPTPAGATPHKLVEPSEATFTSVPKPVEVNPKPAEVAPEPRRTPPPPSAEPDLFSAEGDLTAPELPLTGRAALAEKPAAPLPKPTASMPKPAAPVKPRRDVTPVRPEMPLQRDASASIFAPQRPAPTPPSPQSRLATLFIGGVGGFFKSLVQQTTRPQVRHRSADEVEPIVTRRMLLKASMVFVALVLFTGLMLAFRYVFVTSAAVESEAMPVASAFEPRPVADPPLPYFK